MKKTLLVAAMLLGMVSFATAQTNIQEMYDFNRGHFTTTLEMFQADKWGSTFFFTDIYHPNDWQGPTSYYTEIARALNFWQNTTLAPLSLHVEWNGGNGLFSVPLSYDGGFTINNCWLFGVEYFLHNADFSNTFTFELMYKAIEGATDNIPVQFTFVWGMKNFIGVKGLVFSGFLDIWGEKNTWGVDNNGNDITTGLVALSEPQLWYNLGQHFGCENLFVGGELELAYNFTGGCKVGADNKGFTMAPAAGIKWVF